MRKIRHGEYGLFSVVSLYISRIIGASITFMAMRAIA